MRLRNSVFEYFERTTSIVRQDLTMEINYMKINNISKANLFSIIWVSILSLGLGYHQHVRCLPSIIGYILGIGTIILIGVTIFRIILNYKE